MKIKIPCAGVFELEVRYKFTPQEQTPRNNRVNRTYPNTRSKTNHYVEGATDIPAIIPTTLVLFIKADEASSLIDTIKSNGRLYEGAETVLFVSVMKMWVGTDYQYNTSKIKKQFEREVCSDSFVREYDYVAMRFELSKEYKGYQKGADSYERNLFFTEICKDQIKMVEYSKRLAFDPNSSTEAFDVY